MYFNNEFSLDCFWQSSCIRPRLQHVCACGRACVCVCGMLVNFVFRVFVCVRLRAFLRACLCVRAYACVCARACLCVVVGGGGSVDVCTPFLMWYLVVLCFVLFFVCILNACGIGYLCLSV